MNVKPKITLCLTFAQIYSNLETLLLYFISLVKGTFVKLLVKVKSINLKGLDS